MASAYLHSGFASIAFFCLQFKKSFHAVRENMTVPVKDEGVMCWCEEERKSKLWREVESIVASVIELLFWLHF